MQNDTGLLVSGKEEKYAFEATLVRMESARTGKVWDIK
jgi:hypothetical protein